MSLLRVAAPLGASGLNGTPHINRPLAQRPGRTEVQPRPAARPLSFMSFYLGKERDGVRKDFRINEGFKDSFPGAFPRVAAIGCPGGV